MRYRGGRNCAVRGWQVSLGGPLKDIDGIGHTFGVRCRACFTERPSKDREPAAPCVPSLYLDCQLQSREASGRVVVADT